MELTPLVEWNGINSTRRVEHPGGGGLYYKQYSRRACLLKAKPQ
jgi:hypothetical protein